MKRLQQQALRRPIKKIMVVIPQQSLKLPKKKKIDLTQVTGTGRDGRITRKDVTNFTPTQARTPEKTVSGN